MKKVAIVGVEGSGKTVMMATMGEQWERPDERGYFLSPENAETFVFSKSMIGILRSGNWPSASTIDDMRLLEWSLRRRQDGIQEKIADICMLDYAGEAYRQAFGAEKKPGFEKAVAALKAHLDDADVLIVLVNMSDILNGSISNPRTRDAMWITKGVLDYALRDKLRKPRAAIVFSQADNYEATIAAHGGAAATLDAYLPHVANIYGDLPILMMTAVDQTVPADDGLLVPAPGFKSKGLSGLLDWMIRIGEQDKSKNGRELNQLITEFAPLVHLDVEGHLSQMTNVPEGLRQVLNLFRDGRWTEARAVQNDSYDDGYWFYYQGVCNLFGFGGAENGDFYAERNFIESVRHGVAEANIALGWMAEERHYYGQNFHSYDQCKQRAKQYYDEARAMGIQVVPQVGEMSKRKKK